jgi:uncharacterized protein YegP (UPF0339 family)
MKYIMYQDGKGEWQWELRTANARAIAISAKGYKEERKCRRAIKLIQGSGLVPIKVVK